MAQRKKKPSGHQLQAIAKAHYKNEFMRKLRLFINECCDEDIYRLIPSRMLNILYLDRYHSLKIVKAEGQNVPIEILNNMRAFIGEWINAEPIVLPKYTNKMTIGEFFTIGLTAIKLYNSIDENMFPRSDKVKSALQKFGSDEEALFESFKQLNSILAIAGYFYSKIGSRIYWLQYDLVKRNDIDDCPDNLVLVHSQEAESIQVKINDTIRPAVRLGWAVECTDFEWATIKPSLLYSEKPEYDIPMKVYVQSHALLRLSERIDCIIENILHYNMYESFCDPKICFDSHHNFLIEYRIFGTKAGYFRLDIVKNILVVRTFLFLTNSGTPEGDLLGKNTGLKMLDKKYLAIDKLSTFISSDIKTNPQLKKIFTDSGCQCLFDLENETDPKCISMPQKSTSALMLSYLGYVNSFIPETVAELSS